MLKAVVLGAVVAITSLGTSAASGSSSGGGLNVPGAFGYTDCGATGCGSYVQSTETAVTAPPASAGGSADPNAVVCQDVPFVFDANKVPDQVETLGDPGDQGPYDAYQEQCAQRGKVISTKLVFYPVPSPSSAHALAEKAYKALDLPKPQVMMSPAADVPQLTGLPVWLWLRPGSWVPKSSVVSAPGITIKATATPQRVVWSMGDGSTVTCSGPGTPFPEHPNGDGTASSPTCGHTFHWTSAAEPGGAFHVAAKVVWRVDWTGFGPGGTFPDVESSVGFPVRVTEAAALVTNSH